MAQQGTVLSSGRAQGIILGDDGVRYTFTPLGWQDQSAAPVVGMRVEFEARGSQAVDINPIAGSMFVPGAASQPPPSAPNSGTPSTFGGQAAAGVPGVPTIQSGSSPAAEERSGFQWRDYGWQAGLAVAALAIAAAVVVAVLVRPGGSESVPTDEGMAGTELGDLGSGAMSEGVGSGVVSFELEYELSSSVIDKGESFTLKVRLHSVGRPYDRGGITVSFPSLSIPAGSRTSYSSRVGDLETLSYTSGLEHVTFHPPGVPIDHRVGESQFGAYYLVVESSDFGMAVGADRTLELKVTPKEPGDFAVQVRGWLCVEADSACDRNPVSSALMDQQGFSVFEGRVEVLDVVTVDGGTVGDGEVDDGTSVEDSPSGASEFLSGSAEGAFELYYEVSDLVVERGSDITLAVQMHGISRSYDHGGISVSFPSLTIPAGSLESYLSRVADVELLGYTSGEGNVTYHPPGAQIYHLQGNRQFGAEYLLVESDDSSWSRGDDRWMEFLITAKQSGKFTMQIRGWACLDGYTQCDRVPESAFGVDQQGHAVMVVTVDVVEPSTRSAGDGAGASIDLESRVDERRGFSDVVAEIELSNVKN